MLIACYLSFFSDPKLFHKGLFNLLLVNWSPNTINEVKRKMTKIKCLKLKCPECHVVGSAQLFLNKKNEVRYCRVRHYVGLNEFRKPQFTYHKVNDLGVLKTLYENQGFHFQTVVGQVGQAKVVNADLCDLDVNKLSLKQQSVCLGSLAWWGTALVKPEEGHQQDFRGWLETKEYATSYVQSVLPYAKKYCYILDSGNLRDLDLLSVHRKAHVVKALILLSKFRGTYSEFKAKLSEYGIKWERSNGLRAFLRIFNASNNNILKWYREAQSYLRENEVLFSKFLLHSGLRVSEAIHSFNLAIKLSKEGRLSDYYDSEFQVLCHFKFPKLFIRRTKNCYITFLEPEFLQQITASQGVSYSGLRKRLERKHLRLRFNELRDRFGTYLLSHGVLEAEINLLQGRIPVDIFIRHYWSPKLKELGTRIFKALNTMETMEKSLVIQ